MVLSVRKYKKNECVTFRSTKGKFGALSNMAPGYPILIYNISIKTSESLYQALRFPDYPEIQQEIVKFASPISAKEYSRQYLIKTRSDWDLQRFKIMRFCLQIKLFQNCEKFSRELLATNNLPIVEISNSDRVWGASKEGDYFIGTNALGRLLMELREQILSNTFRLEIPNIENFKLFGEAITLNTINRFPQK
jgi:ribA/ribD-fused uncharacterized protein